MNKIIPEFPIEIWERVIDELWDDPLTLNACALVCRSWLARSRFQLISTTPLVRVRDTHRLAKLLDTHPAMRQWVDTVALFGSINKEEARRPLHHFNTFSLMLMKRLGSVKTLGIYNAQWNPGWSHPHALLCLSEFTSITALVISRTTFSSELAFARLISSLPQLKDLGCQYLTFRSRLRTSFDFPKLLQLDCIHLDGPSDDVADLLCGRLNVLSGFRTLAAGWCDDATTESPSHHALNIMMEAAGPALRSLSVRLRPPQEMTAEDDCTESISHGKVPRIGSLRDDTVCTLLSGHRSVSSTTTHA